jgi:hypothetical protein
MNIWRIDGERERNALLIARLGQARRKCTPGLVVALGSELRIALSDRSCVLPRFEMDEIARLVSE